MGFLSLCGEVSPQAADGGLAMLSPGAAVHLASAEDCPLCHVILQAVGKEADVTVAARLHAGCIFLTCILFQMLWFFF